VASVTGFELVEQPDRWTLDMTGAVVTQCRFDHAVTLLVDLSPGSVELRIEQPMEFERADGTLGVPLQGTAAQMAPALELLQQEPTSLEAYKDGRLRVHFAGGGRLAVEADPDYEVWTLTGPGGLRLVCLPGGDLAVWTPAGP
jgi:Family of unknown function (DUF6188)